MADFLPDTIVAVLSVLFSMARFENQRWIRARLNGYRGSWQLLGVLVDMTGVLALLFSVAFLVAYDYGTSVEQAVGLLVITFVGGMVGSTALGAVLGGDRAIVWLLATLLVWALAVGLATHVSWFGLVRL
ncbi:hypothetical protein F1188_09665 [Roseospira marina]|uniref:Uncharacterized protein n=1 Tax=Roseospira marina TaxID=140057 RepID=A0A5M6ID27_9PROT|nr:hypothetical protein [Roseospira marina]KAA5605867.1 hypothetical protein F1188_09665 [Roseospira marina]MBB4313687.1 hypothetical protein [Roseospira marina]MBB5086849.1 hypothetical protein [Roseospira marina]